MRAGACWFKTMLKLLILQDSQRVGKHIRQEAGVPQAQLYNRTFQVGKIGASAGRHTAGQHEHSQPDSTSGTGRSSSSGGPSD